MEKIIEELNTNIGLDQKLKKIASSKAFAYFIEDTSMMPVFKPNDMIIFDPKIKPLPGEIVLIKLNKSKLPLIRKFIPNPNNPKTCELIAYNKDWPTITLNHETHGTILGTLIEHRCRRRIF